MRILDLDSMAEQDLRDSNYLIVANTTDLYGVSKLNLGTALKYFVTNQAISAATAQQLIIDEIAANIFNGLITIKTPDGMLSVNNGDSANFGLNEDMFTTKGDSDFVIQIKHALKQAGAANTSNTNNNVVSNITIDNHAHITSISSVDLDSGFIPRSEFDFQIVAGDNLSVSGANQFTDANRTITINHDPKAPTLNNLATNPDEFVNGLTFDAQGHLTAYSTQSLDAILSSDLSIFIDSDYIAALVDSSLTKYTAYVADVWGDSVGAMTGIELVDEAVQDPALNSKYLTAALASVTNRFVDAPYVMDRHADKEPTLSNVFPSAGTYLSDIIFDDKGHPVEVGTQDISDYVNNAYVMSHHDSTGVLSSSKTFEVIDSTNTYVTGVNVDNYGHVVSVKSTAGNLDTRITTVVNQSYVENLIDHIYLDSQEAVSLIDSAIAALINGAPGQLDTLKEIADALNNDSDAYGTLLAAINLRLTQQQVINLVDSSYIADRAIGTVDSAELYKMVDSSWIMARHDNIIISDVTSTPGQFVDAITFDTHGHVQTIGSSTIASYVDSAYVNARADDFDYITVIDSSYVQARQVDIYRDSGFVTNIVDSDYINYRADWLGVVDSAYVNARADDFDYNTIIDSAYINFRVDPAVDSSEVLNIIDSNHVRSKINTAFVESLVDSTYVNVNGDTITGVMVFNDSATFSGGLSAGGLTVDSVGSVSFTGLLNTDSTQINGDLYVTGTIDADGDITSQGNVTAYSDSRLKENVELITDAMAKVDQVRGVTFNKVSNGQRGTGVIAQELQAVLPEAVVQGDDGYLQVAYGNVVGLLIEAVKELKSEVEELKQKIK